MNPQRENHRMRLTINRDFNGDDPLGSRFFFEILIHVSPFICASPTAMLAVGTLSQKYLRYDASRPLPLMPPLLERSAHQSVYFVDLLSF